MDFYLFFLHVSFSVVSVLICEDCVEYLEECHGCSARD